MISKIQPHHQKKKAYVYLRQSTMGQVRYHQESTERQYALKEKALEGVTRLIYTWHLDRSEHSFPRETSAFLHTYTCHKALHLAVYSFDSDEFLLG